MKRRWLALALALALMVGLFGCGAAVIGALSKDDPTEQATDTPGAMQEPAVEPSQEPEGEPTQEPTPEATKDTKDGYGVGERAEADGIAVTLTEVEESAGGGFFTPEEGKVFLICHFDIENNTDEDFSISSIVSFDAYADDYATSVSFSAIASSSEPQLDGTVAAGKKMAGVVGYEVPEDWSTLEVTFKPSIWGDEKIRFITEKE